jgi:hypothetical protein
MKARLKAAWVTGRAILRFAGEASGVGRPGLQRGLPGRDFPGGMHRLPGGVLQFRGNALAVQSLEAELPFERERLRQETFPVIASLVPQ